MKFGYIYATFPIFWGDSIKFLPDEYNRLAGQLAPVNELPTLKCENCGIVIGQYQ